MSSKMVPVVNEIREHGHVSEEWCNSNYFPLDTKVDGEEVSRDFSMKQLCMQRHTIVGHKKWCCFNDIHEKYRIKQQDAIDQKHIIARKHIAFNMEAELMLRRMVTKNQKLTWSC